MTPIVLSLVLAAAAQDVPNIVFEKYELPNGLDVILAPDRSTPIVHVNVWYHVGSREEKPGLTGFAHLFEHLMFQGSPSNPGEYFAPLEERGGSGLNGTTSFDRTNYFETVPSDQLPVALFLESDRMGWLLDTLDQAKLDNQREVVRNERRQRYENPPYGFANRDLFEAVFPGDHPYHHMPIGSHEDLQAASLDVVKDFFRTWYAPDNASLTITGDFDPAVAKKLVSQYFGEIPRSTAARERRAATPVVLDGTRVIRQFQKVPEQRVWLAWPSPALLQPGDAELDLLSSLLTDGDDARLYKALVKESGVARRVVAYQQSLALGSTFVIEATPSKGHTTDEVVKAIDAVLADTMGAKGPTIDELEAAKAGFQVGYFASLATIAGRANTLQSYNLATGDPGYITKDLARYAVATPADVARVAGETLQKSRIELHIWPEADKPPEPPPPPAAPAPEPVPGKKKPKKTPRAEVKP